MDRKFNEYSKFNLSDINKEILKKWDEENVFESSIKEREGAPSFVFFEGPPSANGMPGIHHVMARTIKDIICRFKTMKGFQVMRKAGWDTHGLPVELGVEKALGITKEDIGTKISVDDYNAACRKEVMKYTKEWEDLTHRMGYWVDMHNPYIATAWLKLSRLRLPMVSRTTSASSHGQLLLGLCLQTPHFASVQRSNTLLSRHSTPTTAYLWSALWLRSASAHILLPMVPKRTLPTIKPATRLYPTA